MGRDRTLSTTPPSPAALHQSGQRRPVERRQQRPRQAGMAAGDGGAAALSDKAVRRQGSAGRASLEPAGAGRVGPEGPWEGAGGPTEGGRVGPRLGEERPQRREGGHHTGHGGGWALGVVGPSRALALIPPGSKGSECWTERRGDWGGLGRLTAVGSCKGERVENGANRSKLIGVTSEEPRSLAVSVLYQAPSADPTQFCSEDGS